MGTKQVSTRLPEDLAEDLKKTAKKYGTTEAAIIQSALEKELRRIKSEKKPLFE